MEAGWTETHSLDALKGEHITRSGVVFRHHHHLYRTTGKHLANGGMGSAFLVQRRLDGDGPIESCVGKIFHAQYLYQLRTDEVTRQDHESTISAMREIMTLQHPALLPLYVATRIADNFLFVTPRKAQTLLEAVSSGELAPRQRVTLLMQAIEGLGALHEAGVLHRDFTSRNILLDRHGTEAFLFDFDLALSLDDVAGMSYSDYCKGRIFGSPGYSVPPEIVDPALMESAITPRLDIFAIGGALFSLFTDQLPYGEADDMWGLLMRIGEGVVFNGTSRVVYPDHFPHVLKPVIEGCLERDPGTRFGSVGLVIEALDQCLDELEDDTETDSFIVAQSVVQGELPTKEERVDEVLESRSDDSVTKAVIEIVDMALSRYGYQVKRALGRVKGFPIFLAIPVPELLASGQFPDANRYPKIVTAMNLNMVEEPQRLLDLWFGHFLPVLTHVRQGLLTTLHKVEYDEYTRHLFLFSEFVDDPRFGSDLAKHELTLHEALGLGFLVVRQVGQLHEHGMAHNNIRPEALLLKGLRDTRDVQPAMVGLVEPSLERPALVADVRQLAALVLSWIRPTRIESLDERLRQHMNDMRSRLATIAFNEAIAPPGIDELFALIARGFSTLDYNFRVLRENGGDLQEYALLRLSHQLYSRLWTR